MKHVKRIAFYTRKVVGASQPTSQRKPAIDTDDMFAPLLQAVARIKGVEV